MNALHHDFGDDDHTDTERAPRTHRAGPPDAIPIPPPSSTRMRKSEETRNARAARGEIVSMEEAFLAIEPLARALDEHELVPINVDTAKVAILGAAVSKAIEPYRADLDRLVLLDMAAIDRIGLIALALSSADARDKGAETRAPMTPVSTLRQCRVDLLEIVGMLERRQLLPKELRRRLSGKQDRQSIAFDILLLCEILRRAQNEGHGVLFTSDELLERETSANRALLDLGFARASDTANEAADMRVRIFTLLVRAYDEAVRGIAYLRWHHGDADQILPSLYSAHSRARRGRSKGSGA